VFQCNLFTSNAKHDHTRSVLELEQILVKGDLCPVQVPICIACKFVAFVLDKQYSLFTLYMSL